MHIPKLTSVLTLAAAMVAPISAGRSADTVTLTGCLVRGEGDGAGYMLSNAPGEPAWQRSADQRIEPTSVGTSGGFESIFYWLDGDDDLKKHVGHTVRITGEPDDELDDAQIEVNRKKEWTEVVVKSDGRTMKAQVPNASVSTAPGQDGDSKTRVLVRRVDVEKIEMLSATCGTR